MIEMTAPETKQYISENQAVILIDVRESWECNTAFIKGSIHIPISEFNTVGEA